ncbi:MAG: glutamate mutase L [Candidatus Aegiribacteria sp.]|nr:glutamate mutase L [Candidatus Aegiribacteria sp.]
MKSIDNPPDAVENDIPQRNTGLLLITDIGSTTTKALLLTRGSDNRLKFVSMADVPTTVEKPDEDVCIGVSRAIRMLESQTGKLLSRGNGLPSVPYLTTSSAGGGLQMLVFGLTSTETGRIAENTACGAGGVILRTITIDDELQAVEKMMYIQELHPDMILLAGGTDGGAIAGVVRLAELLAIADPKPKFRQNMKIPLIFCGNREARSFVREVLENTFEIHVVDNVRPSMTELNLEPARLEVHRLFMENVMERAPGYSELKNYTISDILPTPVAVENILKLYGESQNESVVLMDMGGATTDIFSSISGEYSRTVAANTGMSYSISNVLADVGIEAIMRHLPPSFKESEIRNYIFNKTLAPTSVPSTEGEELLEQAVAIEGARSAWADHLETCFKTSRVGFLDRMKQRNRKEFDEVFYSRESESSFNISDIGTVIGAGGIISHTDRIDALWILTEAFLPEDLTLISIDRHFRSPHLGVLSTIDSEVALKLFREECLEEIGWVVAPTGKIGKGDMILEVLDRNSDEKLEICGGEFLFLRSGGDLEFRTSDNVFLGLDGIEHLSTDLPVLIDCRGRGEDMLDIPLARSGITEFEHTDVTFSSILSPEHGRIETGDWEIEYRLPYEGDIFVNEGDHIEPGTLIGENRFEPPRLFIIDLNRIPGYDRHLTPEEVRSGLLVGVGDKVNLNQPLYEVHRKGMTGFDFTFRSTVRGLIIKIEKNGLIILREIQDYDEKPHTVDVAGQLGIKPKHIKGYLKFKQGDFVGAEQTLASDILKSIFVKAPSSGILRDIDGKKGTVTLQYDINPVEMYSHIHGTVTGVIRGQSITVQGTGTRLQGVIGFGGTSSGPLNEILNLASGTLPEGSIIFSSEPIDEPFLRRAAESGVSGIIAPSLPAHDWVSFYGKELGVAITGDENIPFTMILTEGFGNIPMNDESIDFLRISDGRTASLSGRTQIRAGVTRPLILVSD